MHDNDLMREIIEGQFNNLYSALLRRSPIVHVLLNVTASMKEKHPFLDQYTEKHHLGLEYIVLSIGTEAARNMEVKDGMLHISLSFSKVKQKMEINLLDIVTIGVPGQEVSFNTNGIWISTTHPSTTGYYAIASIEQSPDPKSAKVQPAKSRSHLTVVK